MADCDGRQHWWELHRRRSHKGHRHHGESDRGDRREGRKLKRDK